MTSSTSRCAGAAACSHNINLHKRVRGMRHSSVFDLMPVVEQCEVCNRKVLAVPPAALDVVCLLQLLGVVGELEVHGVSALLTFPGDVARLENVAVLRDGVLHDARWGLLGTGDPQDGAHLGDR